MNMLDTPYPLPAGALDAYRRDGHVVLPDVFPESVVTEFAEVVRPIFSAQHSGKNPAEETDAYNRAFAQVINLGLEFEAVREFTHCRRLGQIAAELMGAPGARIFVEDWFFKRPGCGHTPWHQDQSAMPFGDARAVTLWVPLVTLTEEMGPLEMASGSHEGGVHSQFVDISGENDAEFQKIVDQHGFSIEKRTTLAIGSISAHDGRTIHRAGSNTTDQSRDVLALHCFAADARILQPDNPSRQRLLDYLAPGLEPGAIAQSPNWPLIYDPGA